MTYKTKEKIITALTQCAVAKPAAIETMAAGVLGVFPKFDQIAFYVPDMDAAKRAYRALGCDTWVDDMVTAQGKIGVVKDSRKHPTEVNVAHLAFNYQLGIELELIQYKAGNNWHQVGGRVDEANSCAHPFASHMSWHTEDIAVEHSAFESKGLHVIQDVVTLSHTNPHLVESGRKYRYIIFDSRNLIGFDLKLIQRVDNGAR